ncbi:MAG: thiol reductant ABC exporter subunit CydC [Solirubrobacterales bacterium 70-9]|nr:MAG: thiol reductant ABC exporter subunit CydC [Solirubrobacterales bacterium 70-9]
MSALRGVLAAAPVPRRRLALSVALGAGAVLAAVGLLTTSGYLISRAAQRPEILALGVAIVGVRFFGIARALLRYAERLVSHDLAFRSLTDLRSHLFHRLIPLVPAGLPGLGRGELLGRFVGDVDSLQDLYLRGLAPPLVAVLAGLGAVVVAFLILPVAALVLALGLLAAGVLVPLVTRRASRSAGRRQAAARAVLGTEIVEIATGSAEIAVAGRAEDWTRRAERSGAQLASLQRRDALSGGLAAGLLTAVAGATVVAILAVAIPAVGSGALPGVMLAALALLAMASFEAVAPLGAAAARIENCAAAAGRIEAVLDREPPVSEPEHPRHVELSSRYARASLHAPELAPALGFDAVRFRYEDDAPWVLDGADLELRPGRAVALLGPSGAGKSTLAELAVRFRDPQGGRIELGGVPLPELAGDDIRTAVRLAPQDAYLFTTTLRDNVALGRADAGDGEICAALAAVGLGPWLDSLPEGLDTEVGEAGAKVSGGQRQRIAAARLFLAEARFLVFDEPTAHLDPEGAADLQRRIAAMARPAGPGVLVITHERAALDAFDEVHELRAGKIVAADLSGGSVDIAVEA